MTTSSYVHGPSNQPLLGCTIGDHFDEIVRRAPDELAIIARHQNIRWTWTEFKSRVDRLAAGFVALGLQAGERVGIWAPNCWEWAATQFATAKAGLVLVNINPAYRTSELEYALNKVGCAAIVSAVEHKSSNYLAMLNQLAPELETCEPTALQTKQLPSLRMVILLGETREKGCLRFSDVCQHAEDRHFEELAARQKTLQFDDPINIQFTSGTTGAPKGASLSHHNILNNGYFAAEAIRLKRGDKLCIPVPLYHCFGMVMGNLGCLTHAATMVYAGEAFDPLAVLETVQAERCNALYGVPTMFIAMLTHPRFNEFDLSSLRTGAMGGAPCPIEVMREVVSKMHMPEVTIAYGMTETSPVSFQSATDDPMERRVSTVGCVQPHIEVKIVDAAGRIVPRGEVGELCTRGYSVMLGYWNDKEGTAKAIDSAGWMHTGDLATLDEEGYCNISGRIKDMIIRGGENIYPREIEEFLFRHPSIQDVQIIGIPDEKYGEEVCAWIIVKEGASLEVEAVTEFCRGQIAKYKIPRYVRFVKNFPTTVTGKPQKFAMRELMIAELEGESSTA
jgi:fatty-acyl-CoA synthase